MRKVLYLYASDDNYPKQSTPSFSLAALGNQLRPRAQGCVLPTPSLHTVITARKCTQFSAPMLRVMVLCLFTSRLLHTLHLSHSAMLCGSTPCTWAAIVVGSSVRVGIAVNSSLRPPLRLRNPSLSTLFVRELFRSPFVTEPAQFRKALPSESIANLPNS